MYSDALPIERKEHGDSPLRALSMIHDYVRRGESFAFETTLSGRSYARLIPHWREQGYSVELFFLQLSRPEIAIARVKQRVAEGATSRSRSFVDGSTPDSTTSNISTRVWWINGQCTKIQATNQCSWKK